MTVDSEKFDKVVLDLLYDELDELTRASAVRHMEQSGRAKALYSELRATREVGALPLVEPPPDLAARILDAEEQVRRARPLAQRFGTAVSILASYAMRPQLAMAALLLLLLGSSLLLLRVKPGEADRMLVTERGVPESDRESIAIPIQRQAERPPSGEPEGTTGTQRIEPGESDTALAARSESRREESVARSRGKGAELQGLAAEPTEGASGLDRDLAEPSPAAAPAKKAMDSALADFPEDDALREERKAGGCAGDLPHYQAIADAPPSAEAGHEAIWRLAQCHEKLGRLELARRGYRALLTTPYAERARAALDALPEPVAATKPTKPPAAGASSAPDTSGRAGAKAGSETPTTPGFAP